jgi:hypothetical protein
MLCRTLSAPHGGDIESQAGCQRVRILDPHVHFADHWIVRRLAPDCCHIEIQPFQEKRDEERLLYYMGWETPNIHLGSRKAIPAVRARSGREERPLAA